MKIQDILFFIILLVLLLKRKPQWFVIAGLLCLVFSLPLFALKIFFSAEHLVYYAAGFFAVSVILIYVFNLDNK